MLIGVPREVKNHEYRVGMTPAGTHALVMRGHEVLVEAGAGTRVGFADAAYAAAGARIVPSHREVWEAQMVVKVKELQPLEYTLSRRGQILFAYLHLAPEPALTQALLDTGTIGIAYETVTDAAGGLPLLAPMSRIAGKLSIQFGAWALQMANGGSGVLLGGVPGVPAAEVVILGGGVVGTNAAKMAAGMGARVTILDINLDRLRYLSDVMPANVEVVYSNRTTVLEAVQRADLVIGGVLIVGGKAPKLIRREDLKLMKPGAVVVDVAVDQGGCIETIKPTTHENPTYIVDDVIHYGVANMPGGVPRTSTLALTNATFPYAKRLADKGWKAACKADPALLKGVNMVAGKVTYPGVAEAFNLPLADVTTFV
jgi:alanine dehydrogenase